MIELFSTVDYDKRQFTNRVLRLNQHTSFELCFSFEFVFTEFLLFGCRLVGFFVDQYFRRGPRLLFVVVGFDFASSDQLFDRGLDQFLLRGGLFNDICRLLSLFFNWLDDLNFRHVQLG